MNKVNINWPGSKEKIASLARQLHDDLASSDPAISAQTLNVEGFLYDLGHSGRGMDKFPQILPLVIDDLQSAALPYGSEVGAVAEISSGEFLEQIHQQAEQFMTNHPWRQGNPQIMQGELNGLKLLAEKTRDMRIKVTFGEDYGRYRSIEDIEILNLR